MLGFLESPKRSPPRGSNEIDSLVWQRVLRLPNKLNVLSSLYCINFLYILLTIENEYGSTTDLIFFYICFNLNLIVRWLYGHFKMLLTFCTVWRVA
jgi:hypothetical protein